MVAHDIHDAYVARRKAEDKSSPTIVPWEQLAEDKRKSNLDAAADVPNKLRVVGHGIRRIPEGRQARIPDLLDNEVETLARMEHERWCREQRMQGVVYGPDKTDRTSPYLVTFDAVPPEVQRYDFESVYTLPSILRGHGYEICRMEEADDLGDPELIDGLARVVHDNYVAKPKAEGDRFPRGAAQH